MHMRYTQIWMWSFVLIFLVVLIIIRNPTRALQTQTIAFARLSKFPPQGQLLALRDGHVQALPVVSTALEALQFSIDCNRLLLLICRQ